MFRTQGVITTKAALALLGLPGGPVRLPLVDSTEAEIAQLRHDLAAGGVSSRRQTSQLNTRSRRTRTADRRAPRAERRRTPQGPCGVRGEEKLVEPSAPRARPAPARCPRAACASSPLGGLGEIGRNMTVFEYGGKLLIVDCGVLFPEEDQPGVDLILPDFSSIRDRLDDVVGVVLTHGHEDHIGAVPYLLREQRRHPADRLQADAGADRGQAPGAPHQAVHAARSSEGERERIGPFDCEFVAVNHSIPDALAVAIRTPAGMVARTPATSRWTSCRSTAGSPTCAPSPGSARRASTCSSSTPPTPRSPASSPPSATSRPVLDSVFARRAEADHRRLLRQPRAPRPAGARRRRTSTAARSPSSAARWCATWASPATSATSRCPAGLLVDVKELDDLPDDKVVLVCTGSQGEPMAALSRMANRDHQIRIGEGDTVILASLADPGQRERGLPGHQRAHPLGRQRRAQGQRQGARLRPRRAPASCCTATTSCKPRNVMPVHGEWRHLRANADLAIATGVPAGPRRHRRGRRRRRPRRRRRHDRRQGAAPATSTSTALGRRRHRGLAQGPAHPRRGGLHLGLRGRRLRHRQGRRRPGDPRPRLRIEDEAFDAVIPKIEEVARRAAADGVDGDRTSSSSSSAASSASG